MSIVVPEGGSHSGDFAYDVALSFLDKDVGMAAEIFEGLRDRIQVFFYPDRQEYLVGRDGEEELGRIFESDARVDVILYREGWGESSWTRIEETAIRNRGFEKSYDDFLIVLAVGETEKVPNWLPRRLIYGDPLRFGVGSAITIIETRLQGLGKEVGPESATERARRLNRELAWAFEKRKLLGARESISVANAEVRKVFGGLLSRVNSIKEESSSLSIEARELGGQYGGVEVSVYSPQRGSQLTLQAAWWQRFSNAVDGSCIQATLFVGVPQSTFRMASRDLRELGARHFQPDLISPDVMGWREAEKEQGFSLSHDLVEVLLDWLLAQLEDDLRRKPKRGGGR